MRPTFLSWVRLTSGAKKLSGRKAVRPLPVVYRRRANIGHHPIYTHRHFGSFVEEKLFKPIYLHIF